MWHYLRGRNISLKVNFLEIHLPVRFFCGWGATAQRVKAFAQLKPWHHLKWQTHLSLPMTAALLGEGQRQRISRACWPSLAKMLSFHFSEKPFLKFWCSALRSTCLCCHRHEPQTHTHPSPMPRVNPLLRISLSSLLKTTSYFKFYSKYTIKNEG